MTRRVLLALLAVLAVFGVGALIQSLWFKPPQPKAVPALPVHVPSETPQKKTAVITEIAGDVESQAAGEAEWTAVDVGQALSGADSVRTKSGGHVSIRVGDAVLIELGENSAFEVADGNAPDTAGELKAGRLRATVTPPEGGEMRPVRITVEGSDAVAETQGGVLDVLRGDDVVTVAAEEGTARVEANGEQVQVDKGEQSVVRRERPPSPPTKIPASLLLKLGRATVQDSLPYTATIEGRTSRGAVLRVNGEVVSPGEDGTFTARVVVKSPNTALVVSSEDALGRHEEGSVRPLVVDTRPPAVKGSAKWQ